MSDENATAPPEGGQRPWQQHVYGAGGGGGGYEGGSAGGYQQGQYSWINKYYYRDPIEDGSQVLQHDGWDVAEADTAMSPYTELGKVVAGLTKQLFGANALGNDFYWSFKKRQPDPHPIVPLRGAYEAHQQVVDQLLQTDEFRQVHTNTQGDDYLAKMATVGTLKEAVKALGPEVLERLSRLQRLSDLSQDADNNASTLEEIAEMLRRKGQVEKANELLEMAARLRHQQMECEKELANGQTALTDEELDAARRGAQAGMIGVADQVQAAADGFSLFGNLMNMNGPGAGTMSGKSAMDTETKMKLANKLMKSDKIRLLAEMAGRFIDIAVRAQYSKTRVFQTEVTDIKLGQDIPRVLPHELALLSGNHPLLRRLFMLNFASEGLMEYEIESREPQGRGPILVYIDDSGSMDGDPEVWSKACALALMKIASHQKRDIVIGHFTTRLDKVDEFPHAKPIPLDDLLETLEYFSGGGTAFEPFMNDALDRVTKSQYDKADVIVITDGLAYVSPEFEQKWNTARKERGMRAYCVLISDYHDADGAKQMARLCDSLLPISPSETRPNGAGDDLAVLNDIFSI